MIGMFVFGMSLASQAGSMVGLQGPGLGATGFVRPLSELLDDAGWTQTPELNGVFKVGSIFRI